MKPLLPDWLRRRRTRRTVELDPLDQYILVALLHDRDLSFRSIHARVEPESRATAAQTVLALAKLEGADLVCRLEQQPGPGSHGGYSLSRLGRRVAQFLPASRRSRIDVRL